MRSMLSAGLLLFATSAPAATYGDATYVSDYSPTHCPDSVAVTLPLSVSVSSRINVSARGTLGGTSNALVYVELQDAGGTTTLALSEEAIAYSLSGNYAFINSDGLLHTPGSIDDPASPIYVATPGNYLLKMHLVEPYAVVLPDGSCEAGSTTDLHNANLTYILLSSAFDRITADGFEAMLSSDNSAVATKA